MIEAALERPDDLALALDVDDRHVAASGRAVGAEPTAAGTGKYGAPSPQKAKIRRRLITRFGELSPDKGGLLELGLLRRSFVPAAAQRELRDVVRYRRRLIENRTQEANRLQKVLETANIKLGSVATEILGVSARAMIKALIAGHQPPAQVAELAQRSLRRKRGLLAEALTGRVTAHHRFLLEHLLRHIEFLDDAIATCDREIATRTAPQADALACLDTIPGVAQRTAEVLVAELGVDMTRFPTAGHAAGWAGLCPGTNESAGSG